MQMREVGYVNFENHCKNFLRELQWISMISNTKHLGGGESTRINFICNQYRLKAFFYYAWIPICILSVLYNMQNWD